MAKAKKLYICNSCKSHFSKWTGQCPNCKEWNTLEEVENTKSSSGGTIATLKKLKEVKSEITSRVISGIEEFDRVVGGGMVEDSIIILSAPPGTGKSTLCMMLADKMLGLGKITVYASGEESASQLKNRAIRLDLKNIDDMYISETTCLDSVLILINEVDADFIIVDSIQTFTLNEFLPSRAGNPTQVMECASALQDLAKRSHKPRIVIIIGQMNKEDELVGTRALEHLVDTTLILDGESDESFRMLFTKKNRFGDTGETGFFQMTEKGLLSVDNPSEFFLTERTTPMTGTALTVLKEGSRPIVIEIESLVTQSFTPYPSRISEAMKKDQLNVLLSILEQHCKMNFFNKNVVIKTQNNMKLKSSDTNLAILMTIASSYYKKAIPLNTVFLSDVGLTGELKKIPNLEIRLKELDRMGYETVYISKNSNITSLKLKHLKVKQVNTIAEVLTDVFNDK